MTRILDIGDSPKFRSLRARVDQAEADIAGMSSQFLPIAGLEPNALIGTDAEGNAGAVFPPSFRGAMAVDDLYTLAPPAIVGDRAIAVDGVHTSGGVGVPVDYYNAAWRISTGSIVEAASVLPAPSTDITDLSLEIAALWATALIITLDGEYPTTLKVEVPTSSRLLEAEAATALIKPVNASSTLSVIELTGNGAQVIGLGINGNLAAREAAGFNQYTHGIYALNRSNVTVQDVSVTDYGETASFTSENTGAVVIDHDSVTTPTIGGTITNVTVNDTQKTAPYGIRVRSPIIGYARGETAGNYNGVIDHCTLIGTKKNAIEICGADVHDWTVRNTTLRDWEGQGGIETDYGSYNCTFEDCEIYSPGPSGVMVQSTVGFSFRSSDQGDGKLKEGENNAMRRCYVHDVTTASTFTFAGFELISCRESVLEDISVYNIYRGAGVAGDRSIGIRFITNFGEVNDITITRPMVGATPDGVNTAAPDYGFQISGSNPCTGITVDGGKIRGQTRGFNEATATPISGLLFTGGVEITGNAAVFLASGRVTPVSYFDGATLRGNSIGLNASPSSAQFVNTKFILPPLGLAALEASLPGITGLNGNSYERMPPGEGFLLRRTDMFYGAKETAYQDCLDGLLADGILDKLDVLIVPAAPHQTTALLNTVQNQNNAAAVGSPVFTAGQGFSGMDGTNHVALVYNPSAGGLKFTRDSAFLALWKGPGDILTRTGTSVSRISGRVSRNIDWRPNMITATTAIAPADYTMAWWTRPNSTNFSYGYDGTTVGNNTAGASEALTPSHFLIGATGGTSSTGNGLHKAMAAGQYLTIAEKEQLRLRVNTLLGILAE